MHTALVENDPVAAVDPGDEPDDDLLRGGFEHQGMILRCGAITSGECEQQPCGGCEFLHHGFWKSMVAPTRFGADCSQDRLARVLRAGLLLAGAALIPLGCAGLAPLTTLERQRLAVFDAYWEALDAQYPLFGRRGVAWDEVRGQYRAAVPFAERPDDFYHLLAGMLSAAGTATNDRAHRDSSGARESRGAGRPR